jgi:hypothetical protein
MRTFELKLGTGKVVVWDGRGGEDACRNYADAHPGVTVVAWRAYPRTGLFVGIGDVVEPRHWRYGR